MNEREQQLYDKLRARGYGDVQARGILMNWQDESGLNAGIEERVPNVHGTRGIGLYQATGPRREQFESMYGTDYSDDNWLDFQDWEFQNTEKRAYNKLMEAETPGQAATAYMNYFLRPAEEHRRRREARYMGGNLPSTGYASYAPQALRSVDPMQAQPYIDDDTLQQMVDAGIIPAKLQMEYKKMRRAEDMMGAESPEGLQAGGLYVAANPLQHIGTVMNRYRGRDKRDEIEGNVNDMLGQVGDARVAYGQALRNYYYPQGNPGIQDTPPAPVQPSMDQPPSDGVPPMIARPEEAPQAPPQDPGMTTPSQPMGQPFVPGGGDFRDPLSVSPETAPYPSGGNPIADALRGGWDKVKNYYQRGWGNQGGW